MMVKPRTKFYACATVHKQLVQDLLSMRLLAGNDVECFEHSAAEYFGSKYAIAVPMARVGIYLCIKHFCRSGQKVLQSPYTLSEVINMTTAAGCKPLFSDVDRNNGHLDPHKLAGRLAGQDLSDIGAMLVTHLHGIPAEMEQLQAFAAEHNIPLIEDAAQSAGAKYGDRYVGTIGDAGVFSFGIHKQMNSVYGGLVLTDNPDLANFIKHELSGYSRIPTTVLLDKQLSLLKLQCLTANPFFSWCMFPLLRYGALNNVEWINRLAAVETKLILKHRLDDWYTHRMSPSQARMLRKQLQQLHVADNQRIRTAETYQENLAGIEGLITPVIPTYSHPTFAQYPVQVPDAQNLLRWLNFYGQDVVAQHFYNCADLECYSDFHFPCPVATQVAGSLILLPTYPGYSTEQVRRNAEIVKRYFAAEQPIFDGTDRLRIHK